MNNSLSQDEARLGVQALLPWAARFAAQHRCAYALVDWHGEGGKDLRIGLGRRSAGNLKHVFVRVAIVGHGGDWQLLVNLPFAPRLFAEFNGQPTIDGTARTVVRLQRDELARLTHLAALAYRAQLAS